MNPSNRQNWFPSGPSTLLLLLKLGLDVFYQIKYKEAYESGRANFLGTTETPEMKLAKELEPIRNKKIYEADARDALKKTHHGPGKRPIQLKPITTL